jgi:hypothetical protein
MAGLILIGVVVAFASIWYVCIIFTEQLRNYLDGVHLKTMALNGPDGTIHVFTATDRDWRVRRGEPNYFAKLDAEAKAIAERGVTYTLETMPKLHYNVIINPIPLTSFQRRYLWSDEIRILDNKTDEVIAYNRRLMRRWYMIAPDFAFGNRYYSPEAMCGYDGIERFDEDVVSGHTRKFFPSKHREILNQRIFRKSKEVL